ncbi:MAG: acyl-CoA dehydrogenase [Pseudomonadota bacterium]
MNFDLTEEQELFRSSIERFAAPVDVEARRKLRMNPGGYDRTRWSELAELGLIAVGASEDKGGMGSSPVDLALIAEAIGAANAPDPWLENGILPTLLLSQGGDAHLEGVLSGETIATFAWAERNMRYNLRAAHMKAEMTAVGVALTGEKTFVFGSGLADLFIVTADLEGETAAFCVPRETPGLEIRSYRLTDGSVAGELRMTRATVSADAKLDLDLAELVAVAAEIRLLASAEMVGLGQRLLNDTLAYVKEREQFGVAIGSFQALQHRLVDCYAKIEQARSMLYRAALAERDDNTAWLRTVAGAKAYVSESVDHIAREAVQLHGGMGVTDELAIGHALKRVLVLARLFGDVDSNLTEYARAA